MQQFDTPIGERTNQVHEALNILVDTHGFDAVKMAVELVMNKHYYSVIPRSSAIQMYFVDEIQRKLEELARDVQNRKYTYQV